MHNTRDLMTAWGKEAALAAARRLTDAGAGSLVLACTGYATIGMAAELRRSAGILAVDPVRAAGLMTWYALGMPKAGRKEGGAEDIALTAKVADIIA